MPHLVIFHNKCLFSQNTKPKLFSLDWQHPSEKIITLEIIDTEYLVLVMGYILCQGSSIIFIILIFLNPLTIPVLSEIHRTSLAEQIIISN